MGGWVDRWGRSVRLLATTTTTTTTSSRLHLSDVVLLGWGEGVRAWQEGEVKRLHQDSGNMVSEDCHLVPEAAPHAGPLCQEGVVTY